MTKWQLFGLLAATTTAEATIAGQRGTVLAIEREDGSGNSFNVTLVRRDHTKITVYVRTID